MARRARIKVPNQIYSVVTRINNYEYHFSNKAISEAFLSHLKQVKKNLKFKLFAFVIMSTHVHLLIQPDDEIADISMIMCQINGQFSQKFNGHNKRKGHFWMQRFASKIVENGAYLANTIIYFFLNPLRAGITDNPLKYSYSSVHALTGKKYQDLVDELPKDLVEVLKEFLKRNDYFELIEKCVRIMKRFSFNLTKAKFDQRFKDFTGSYEFMNLYNKKFCNR